MGLRRVLTGGRSGGVAWATVRDGSMMISNVGTSIVAQAARAV